MTDAVTHPLGVKFEEDEVPVVTNVPVVAGDVVVTCEVDDNLELEVVELVNAGAVFADATNRLNINIIRRRP